MPGYPLLKNPLKIKSRRCIPGAATAWLWLAASGMLNPAQAGLTAVGQPVPLFQAGVHEADIHAAEARGEDRADRRESDAGLWLERLSVGLNRSGVECEENRQYSYRGVFIYQYGDHSESLRITHGRVDGQQYERLEHLDGERREIILRGEQLTRIQADNRLTRFYRKQNALRAGLGDLQRNYILRSLGDTRIADRSAIVLAIEPRDELRYGYRLTLDQDTALILGWELLDNDDRMLERFRFTTIDIDDLLPAAWVAEPAGADALASAPRGGESGPVANDGEPTAIDPRWRPEWLPPGFDLTLPVSHPDEQVQTYSDGLAVISVFLERTDDVQHDMGDGVTRRGATVAYLHRVELNGDDYMVTVLGEVPRTTAQQVAQSVTWLGDGS